MHPVLLALVLVSIVLLNVAQVLCFVRMNEQAKRLDALEDRPESSR
jgi:hypothetical protein